MILFRKEAKKILREHGFSEDFTVNKIDRHIWLVGKCGKQIVQISDLEVGNKLSKAERELLIEDYLYPNIIMKKVKIDRLLSIEQAIENIDIELAGIEKKDQVYIDTDYNYAKARNIGYIVSQVSEKDKYVAKLKENLDTHERHIIMNNVPQEDTCNIYNKLLGKLPIRTRVFNLYTEKLKLKNNILKIKKELKIVC